MEDGKQRLWIIVFPEEEVVLMKFQLGSCASWPVHRWFRKKAGIEVLGFVADRKLL